MLLNKSEIQTFCFDLLQDPQEPLGGPRTTLWEPLTQTSNNICCYNARQTCASKLNKNKVTPPLTSSKLTPSQFFLIQAYRPPLQSTASPAYRTLLLTPSFTSEP